MLGSVQPGRCILIHGLCELQCSVADSRPAKQSQSPGLGGLMLSLVFLLWFVLARKTYPTAPAIMPGRLLARSLAFVALPRSELRSGS